MNYQSRGITDQAIQGPSSYKAEITAAEALLKDHPAWNGVTAEAVHEIDRAIDRVDDPFNPGGARSGIALLPHHCVVGSNVSQIRPNEFFAPTIKCCDNVSWTRLRVCHDNAACRAVFTDPFGGHATDIARNGQKGFMRHA